MAEMGLGGVALDRPAGSLSGGEATRAALAALLIAEPDVILLDEPTNNLDAAGRAAIVELLARWKGGALTVSHDRALLRQMHRIVELTSLGARVYGGGYDLYAERKTEEEAAAERALGAAEESLSRVRDDIQTARERKAKRDAAGRRARAKGGQPRILLNAMKGKAEDTGGKLTRIADRLRDQGRAATLADAPRPDIKRVRRPALDLPSSASPAVRKFPLAFEEVGHRLARTVAPSSSAPRPHARA